jgi:hypothetical protein
VDWCNSSFCEWRRLELGDKRLRCSTGPRLLLRMGGYACCLCFVVSLKGRGAHLTQLSAWCESERIGGGGGSTYC